ncbi:hypothetical protein FRC18_008657 [Serendipita sp. 400]|nr:hypothetical protein FRC18_008657 [Serendipita sp. 400]
MSFEILHLVLENVGRIRVAEGPSMLPTLSVVEYSFETRIRHEYFPQTLKRGQLVTYRSPLDPNALVCKRIIGLPGDTILVDPMTVPAPSADNQQAKVAVSHVVVPRGHIWVEGDNAAVSRDSRTYGPIPMALVCGRLHAGVWSIPGPRQFRWYKQSLDVFPSS